MSGDAFKQTSAAAEPISYAPASNVVSVRGFRLLVFLTLVNTTLLGGYVFGPQLSGFAQGQWAAYQQRRADRQAAEAAAVARQAAMAAEAKAMASTVPPGTLLYDDDPALRDPGASTATPVAPWPSVLPRPEEAEALPAKFVGTTTVLFMHERRASASSPSRLVSVFGGPPGSMRSIAPMPDARIIEAVVVRPTSEDADADRVGFSRASMDLPKAVSLRLFAGEPDASNASRFVIPYELAGERGLIHGQIQGDDAVRLVPEGPLVPYWRTWVD